MKIKKNTCGQALVTLLFFTLIGITIISTAVIILLSNTQNGVRLQQGIMAYEIAQSGAENAMLQLLRDPDYQGETFKVGDGTVIVEITSNSGNYIIKSTGKIGNFIKKVQVIGTNQDYKINFSPMKEIYN